MEPHQPPHQPPQQTPEQRPEFPCSPLPAVPFARSRKKRPRIINPGNDISGPPKRLKRPEEVRHPTDISKPLRQCAFCLIQGATPECEGEMLGPFREPAPRRGVRSKHFWTHRNCIFWSPAVCHKKDKILHVQQALVMARKRKCFLCNGPGASVHCMYKSTKCCRPMHFRCALQGGASFRGEFRTFCPKHAKSEPTTHPQSLMEDFIDQMPVPEQFLRSDAKGCTLCDGDVYDADRGSVLTCVVCSSRQHSKCLFPNLLRDVTFATSSYRGKYYCRNCIRCIECGCTVDRSIFHDSDKENDHFQDDEDETESNSVKCISCKHNAIHKSCLPPGTDHKSWRCDYCFICRHCNVVGFSRELWNETHEACLECAKEILKGGVVCPCCSRVYREGEQIPMIQCDYCDKWIHAIECGGMTKKEFKAWGGNGKKYSCPICAKLKKQRAGERRKSQGSKGYDPKTQPFGASREDLDAILDTILRFMPSDDDGLAFHSIRRAATQGHSLENVFRDLSIGKDMCQHCCSSGAETNMRYCVDCGECFHDFCCDAKVAVTVATKGKSTSHGVSVVKKETVVESDVVERTGRLGLDALPWRCGPCETFAFVKSHKRKPSIGAGHNNMNGTYIPSQHGQQHSDHEKANGNASDVAPTSLQNGHHLNVKGGIVRDNGKLSGRQRLCSVLWDDERSCALCGRHEEREGAEGRLIPWASSTVADVSHSWVHVGCIMWCNGVSIHGSRKQDQPDCMLGARKYILGKARRTSCKSCAGIGASITCAAPGCETSYHFGCARDIGVAGLIDTPNETLKVIVAKTSDIGEFTFDLTNVHSLHILCHSHKSIIIPGTAVSSSISDTQSIFNTSRVIRAIDRQGFSPDAEPPRKKTLSPDRMLSLRIGSISVLQFGQLVPEVNDFIMNLCLVPLGYCAAKRFWSFTNPGMRCIYFLEVCGHEQSGPLFVIRCSDAPMWRVEDMDPDEAWNRVIELVLACREANYMAQPSFQSSHTTGLEVFGLLNCIPIVTHIESLPMASMFSERYRHKRVVTHRNNDIIFYNTLAKKYKPVTAVQNNTGSARSEGYLPKSLIAKSAKLSVKNAATYENTRSGAAFQLQVARDIFSRTEKTNTKTLISSTKPKLGRHVSKSNVGVRNAKTKSAPNQSIVTEHKGVAASSKTRTMIMRSDIEGWGVFATKDIPAGEMIIEYVGEMIRPPISDIREKQYCDKGIGCYMFQIVPGEIVDATMCGNAARYINHSCAPNCFSKTITLENNRQVVVIVAKRRIQRGEELSYDYQFPLDETDRVKCECGATTCKGFMN